MKIIEERDRRTVVRKIRKKEYDAVIELSAKSKPQTVRLLDEGAVVDAMGRIDFYIMKGTLEKYMDALPDDYEGSINIGHNSFATFPFIVGKWTKKDLHLVDIGDGRKGLDVDLRLDDGSYLVKELRRADYTLGVSAEFTYHVNEEASNQYGFMILDEIFIRDFAIVGDAGNVNSSGIELETKGGPKVDLKKLLEALGEDGEVKDLAAVNALLDEAVEAKETPSEELSEEAPAEEPEKELEASEEPEAAPEKELEAEPETEEPEKELEAEETPDNGLAELSAAITQLMERVSALEAENKSLTEQLAAKDRTEQEFVSKFKSLTVSLTKERKAPEAKSDAAEYTDGIGE